MRSTLITLLLFLSIGLIAQEKKIWDISEIRVRDPFVLVDKEEGTYYLYAQMANRLNRKDTTQGFEVYKSKDLKTFTGPEPVFVCKPDFWGGKLVWAPEVHKYKGKYYLFVTFTGFEEKENPLSSATLPLVNRGSAVLYADSPEGPFKPFKNEPHTPKDWMALDGTLWEEDGQPYMIFCHEWIQLEDGTMELVKLKDDLSAFKGKPKTLFKATDAKWVRSLKESGGLHHGYITDGPWFYTTKTGKLLMIWSSFGENGYAVGLAESTTGSVKGPWIQHDEPFFKENGGHGMMFTTLEGKLMLTLHQPNGGPEIRARFFELEDTGDALILKE